VDNRCQIQSNVAKIAVVWQISGVNFPVNEKKATDAVARLIQKSGADVDYLRISKLIYLADRKSLVKRGVPIVGGRYYSMKKGPTIGEVMDFVNRRNAPRWKEFISARKGHKLNLIGHSNFDSLSAPELEILDEVVTEHFSQSTDDLVDWCHKNCPEYEEVFWGRRPINVEKILDSEGKSEAQIKKIADRAKELSELKELLA